MLYIPRVLWLASMHCPNLQCLTYCSDEFPPTSNSLWSLANGCRHLRYLNIPPVLGSPNAYCFNDACLLVIGHSWPGLVSLSIGGNSISTKGLVDIGKFTIEWKKYFSLIDFYFKARYCRSLEYLEIIHGPILHRDAMEELCQDGGLSSLIKLRLNFTPTSHVALRLLSGMCVYYELIACSCQVALYFTFQSTVLVCKAWNCM